MPTRKTSHYSHSRELRFPFSGLRGGMTGRNSKARRIPVYDLNTMDKWFDMYRTIVMPAHCDHYGHMNVRHYAAFFDDAGWQILRLAGVSLADLRARGLGSVVATLTIDFHHEITAGQLALIRAAITKVGRKSFAYELRLFEVDSMTHCATQKTVEVCFDTSKRVAAAYPEDVRAKLQAVL